MDAAAVETSWWAQGLLFENCNCQLVCPGHVHFTQSCTHERCQGFWAIRFDGGAYGDVPLAGLRAAVVYDTPRQMSQGGWTETLFIDAAAAPAQRDALERILNGSAGGPWAVLARFVSEWRPTQFVPIEIVDEGAAKSITIAGWLRGAIAQIRGRDRTQPVRFENIYNQIHNASQVLARGETEFDDGRLRIRNQGTHGLYSEFTWRVA
ncbi:MAG TPA: DUF1326 domain-containing protein [Terriglobales bacterium]|nr:DUF1326 domain-containing protein [Terriglobales bacterium]